MLIHQMTAEAAAVTLKLVHYHLSERLRAVATEEPVGTVLFFEFEPGDDRKKKRNTICSIASRIAKESMTRSRSSAAMSGGSEGLAVWFEKREEREDEQRDPLHVAIEDRDALDLPAEGVVGV